MRLRRRRFEPRVQLQAGAFPVLIGMGWCTLEATADEARQLAVDLVDALDTLANGGGQC